MVRYFDIAVDPLEGTNFAANNLPGATSVIAIAEKGNLFNAPETYMDKIATGPIEKGLVDLDFPLKKNTYKSCRFPKQRYLITHSMCDG